MHLAENFRRYGVTCVLDERLAHFRNNFVQILESIQPSIFLFMVVANNLYGVVMEKFALPLYSFEFNDKTTLEEIMNTSADSDIGFILDGDLTKPDHFHDAHSDYPIPPAREIMSNLWFSDVQTEMMKKLNISNNVRTTPKFVQNFFPKKNHTVSYIIIQLYIKLVMIVDKIYRVLHFRQENFTAPDLLLITEL